jgi:hypothetical protein
VRTLPVRAPISPKKSPAVMDESERTLPSGAGAPAIVLPERMK